MLDIELCVMHIQFYVTLTTVLNKLQKQLKQSGYEEYIFIFLLVNI